MERDLQRIELKMLVEGPAHPDLDPLLAVFDRWRKQENAPSDWVDLADYAHMPKGPGVMMAGKRENFALDLADPGPGVFFTGKKDFSGSTEERFLEAFRRFLSLASALVADPEYPAELKAKTGEWIVTVNDRLNFPNNAESDGEVRPGLQAALGRLFDGSAYSIARDEDPQHRLSYRVSAESSPGLEELAARL